MPAFTCYRLHETVHGTMPGDLDEQVAKPSCNHSVTAARHAIEVLWSNRSTSLRQPCSFRNGRQEAGDDQLQAPDAAAWHRRPSRTKHIAVRLEYVFEFEVAGTFSAILRWPLAIVSVLIAGAGRLTS